jgi:hypothetical protein
MPKDGRMAYRQQHAEKDQTGDQTLYHGLVEP